MNSLDIIVGALTAWRENRGGGKDGMQSVINVIVNRARIRRTSPYTECVRPMQFSSMTAPGDPQLIKYPAQDDAEYAIALQLMNAASNGVLDDITNGATFYYAETLQKVPSFFGTLTHTVTIAGQRFFR